MVINASFNGSTNTLTFIDNIGQNNLDTSGLSIDTPQQMSDDGSLNIPNAPFFAYTASAGDTSSDTVVSLQGRGGADFIDADNSLIESGGVQVARYVIDAGNGSDTVWGSDYDDIIDGGRGNDRLNFGASGGDDLVNGGRGRDTINGGSGNDTLNGDEGNDRIDGGSGRDTISGGTGRDRMDGDGGRDVLNGDEGDDRYTGGNGRDTFVFDSDDSMESDELDRITDWNRGRDQIDLTGIAGLESIEVLVTGSRRVDMLLLNSEGDTIQTIDITATSTGGRNILLQESAYGDGSNSRVITDATFDPAVDLIVML